MNAVKKLSVFIAIMLFALFFAVSVFVRADDQRLCNVWPDGRGGFFITGKDPRDITFVDSSGSKSQSAYFDIEEIVSDNYSSFAAGYQDGVLNLFKCGSSSNVLMLGNIKHKKNCLALSGRGDIFVVPEDEDNVVICCTHDNQRTEALVSEESIDMLFLHRESGKVFALTDSGVTDISEKRFIACRVPALPVKLNNNIFCGNDGCVYSFSENIGFEKTGVFDNCDSLCCTDDAVYTLYDNSILKQNMNGEILGIYSPSDIIIDDIAASGHNAAAVCGGTVLILKEKDFKVFKPDEPSDNEPVQSSTKLQESSQKPQNSAKPQESSQKPQSSAKPQESSQKPQSSAKPQESSQKPQSSAKPQESSQEPQSSAKLQESSQKPQSSTKPQESSQKQQSSTKPQESSQKPQSSDPRVNRRTQDRSSRTESSSVLPQNEEVFHKTDIMIESDTYIIRDSVIENVPYETTIAMIKKNIRYSGEMRFINYNGKELKSGKLGTGAVIEITAANGQTYRYDLVVPGDITGEGSFNSNDVRKIVKAATNEEELSTPQLLAADVNHDDVFDILDISILCGEYYKNECSSGKGAFLQ